MPQLRVNEPILELNSFFLFLGTLIRLVPILPTCEAHNYSTSSSSSTSSTRKSVVVSIISSLLSMLSSLWGSTSLCSFSFGLKPKLPFLLGLLIFVLGNWFASGLTSTSAPLTLFSAQLLFRFQSHLIIIFHHSDGYHAHLILDVISQAIHVSGNFFIIAFLKTCSDV